MRVVWADAAGHDVYAITDYIAERSPEAAIAMEATITRAVARLANFPQLGRPGRRGNTRELVISSTPYIAVYDVGEQQITILRVIHGAQRWPNSFD